MVSHWAIWDGVALSFNLPGNCYRIAVCCRLSNIPPTALAIDLSKDDGDFADDDDADATGADF